MLAFTKPSFQGRTVKYFRIFIDAFMESAATEFGVQLARFMIWAWRGAYFTVGAVLILWLLGWVHPVQP